MQAHSIAIATVVTLSAFLTETSRQAGLVATVRVGEDEYRQTTATCPDPGVGSVVPVQDGVEGPATARFELSSGVRAVSAKWAGVVPRIVDMKFRQAVEVPTTIPR